MTLQKEHGKYDAVRAEAWRQAAEALLDQVQTLPLRADYPYVEPSDLPGIVAQRRKGPNLKAWKGSKAKMLERLHGGWLGRICGCFLGKPVEGCKSKDIQALGESQGNWPLADYLRKATPAEGRKLEKQGVKAPKRGDNQWRDGINGMVEDDDTNYTVTGFVIVKRFGSAFTPQDVAWTWGNDIPIWHTCTAERVAYRNFVQGMVPPQSATYRNPYREWIGAQIRADYFGYANPGRPQRAAEWAWRDASISHVKNGIYGEMWVAAMVAAAYVESDLVKIIRAGLAEVPAQSRLVEDVEKMIAAYEGGKSFAEAMVILRQQWDEYQGHDWCHTNSNAEIVAAALLWGGDDFEKTIAYAVMPGFDTDCNGATAGSVWGVRYGLGALPRKWTKRMKDRIRTGVAGYNDVKISALAQEMVEVALKNK